MKTGSEIFGRAWVQAGANGSLNTQPTTLNCSAYWLMELELIEPSLYLRMDAGAPERFARALHDRVPGAD